MAVYLVGIVENYHYLQTDVFASWATVVGISLRGKDKFSVLFLIACQYTRQEIVPKLTTWSIK